MKTRYIPNLLKYNLQQLHDLMYSIQSDIEMSFIHGGQGPVSSKQQFFISKLMREKRAAGEEIECDNSDCMLCSASG